VPHPTLFFFKKRISNLISNSIDSATNQRHNRTVGKTRLTVVPHLRKVAMGKFATSPFNALLQDASLAHADIGPRQVTGANPVLSNDIVHELRQPLGVIDSLAYYLELIATDDKSSGHLQRIRAMVAKTNSILERAVEHEERSFEPEFVGS